MMNNKTTPTTAAGAAYVRPAGGTSSARLRPWCCYIPNYARNPTVDRVLRFKRSMVVVVQLRSLPVAMLFGRWPAAIATAIARAMAAAAAVAVTSAFAITGRPGTPGIILGCPLGPIFSGPSRRQTAFGDPIW